VPRAPLEIRKTPAAEQDLIDIWLYTAKEWGAGQADLYLDALDAALARLRDHPWIGADAAEIRAGYRRHGAGQHRIYYRVGEEAIEIVRILHVSRDATAQLGPGG
jgi:toxin ParE1/3/4